MRQQGKKLKAENKIVCHAPLPVHWLLLLFLLINFTSTAQGKDSLSVNKKKLNTIVVAAGAGYGVTLFGLHQLWYKNSERQSFRFFNDNAEWKQVDKLGHFYSSFYFSYSASHALQGCNVPEKKSALAGALTGFFILAPIELLDGYSDAYGASTGDLIANAAGPSFFIGQKLLWDEVRIIPKFSFHRTDYASLRPEVLGENTVSEFFKDYNGQTYWLSADMDKFMRFPKWLNLAVGYGAHGMVYGRDSENKTLGYDPFRQYYLSVDLDLTAVQSRSKVVKTLLFLASAIKIPAPALALSRKGLTFHALYF